MKRKLMIKRLSAVLAFIILPQVDACGRAAVISARATEPQASESAQDWPEQERIDRTYQLSPGACVVVSMIYGPVDIVTGDAGAAEVHIVRYARSRDDLSSRKISVEQTAGGLVVSGEQDHSEGPAKVRHRVLLKIPRRVELSVEKVNARLNVGEIDGPIRLSRINGAVKVARATTFSEISRINGSLTMTIAGLSKEGTRADDINGAIELRFADELNADLLVTEFNGAVTLDVANVSVLEKTPRTVFRARIGSGGSPISINDVNGSVRLTRAG